MVKDKDTGKKTGRKLHIFALLSAIIIIVAILGEISYIAIYNNYNGIADRYRTQIKNIPVLNRALKKTSGSKLSKQLTESQLRAEQKILKQKNKELTLMLSIAKNEIKELSKLKNEQEKIKSEINNQKLLLDTREKQLEEDKKELDNLAANGDKAGFKEYFEKIDNNNAQLIYARIMKEQKEKEYAKKIAVIYENMDPAAAAKIIEQMGKSEMKLIVNILDNMKNKISAQILSEMTPEFASAVTKKLSG